MKKAVFSVGLAILLVGILLVGTGATPLPPPWESMLQALSTIDGNTDGIEQSLQDLARAQTDNFTSIETRLDVLGDDIGLVKTAVDALSDSVVACALQTEWLEGDVPNGTTETFGDLEGPIMHVSVTIWKYGAYVGDSGSIAVKAYQPGSESSWDVARLRKDDFMTSFWNSFTFEFNARKWGITVIASPDLVAHYTATQSYAAPQ